jgi:hypothetical protein
MRDYLGELFQSASIETAIPSPALPICTFSACRPEFHLERGYLATSAVRICGNNISRT